MTDIWPTFKDYIMCGPGPSVANGEQVEYLFRFNNGYNILNNNNTTSGYKFGYLK